MHARIATTKLVPLLAFAAGGVDAVVILGFQILTAAQTGNSVLFAVALARGEWETGLSSALSVLGFLGGAIAGGWLCERTKLTPVTVLALEAAVLAAVLAGWLIWEGSVPVARILVFAAACAMGLQSAVMRQWHERSTTYVTGVLTAFAGGLVRRPGPAKEGEGSEEPAADALTWLVYFLGAVAAGWLFTRHGPVALLVPLSVLVAAAALARRAERG